MATEKKTQALNRQKRNEAIRARVEDYRKLNAAERRDHIQSVRDRIAELEDTGEQSLGGGFYGELYMALYEVEHPQTHTLSVAFSTLKAERLPKFPKTIGAFRKRLERETKAGRIAPATKGMRGGAESTYYLVDIRGLFASRQVDKNKK